jgi:hypothetical protein
MASPQTVETIANELFGAVKIEVSSDGSTWYDYGAVDGAVFKDQKAYNTVESQNVEDRKILSDQMASIEFTQIEVINPDIENVVGGSLVTIVNVAAAPVVGASQTAASGSWNYNNFIKFDNQNGDGTIISVTSVTGGTDGALVEGTDFFVGQNDAGEYGIFIIDSLTVTTESQDMVIIYDYTPNASTEYHYGGKFDVDEFQLRLTNIETVAGVRKSIVWTFYKCTLANESEFAFKKYNEEDTRVSVPIVVEGRKDVSRDAGKQLYKRVETVL